MATQLGLEGQVVSAATQANGDVLPLSDVGSLELCINGLPITEQFLSAPLSHYDIILGESWLRHHRGIMDYAHDQLWQLLPSGPVPLNLDILPPGEIGCPCLGPSPPPYVSHTVDRNLAAMVTEGCRPAQQPWLQLPVPPTQYTELERQQQIFNTPLPPHLRTVDFGGTWMPPNPYCARVHRQEKKRSTLATVHRLGDVGKELPEDAEILDFLDADIPGLTTNPERSFDFVTSEVRTQLAHLPAQQVEDILTLLGGFENTVFETRTMPRMPPVRQLDMDIKETSDARPVAMRHYPVAPQHMPELERQIKTLLDAGIIRKSVSLYASPVLFAPKKDNKLHLCVDYRRLNRQTLRDCYPTPVASDLIARTRGSRMFSKLDLQSDFHQLRIREGDQHKTAFTTPGGQYEWATCPFGLTNTPSCFQRLMNHILRDHIAGHYCVVYCDDILIFTNTDDPVEHFLKLTAVLETLHAHELLI